MHEHVKGKTLNLKWKKRISGENLENSKSDIGWGQIRYILHPQITKITEQV